ncbi:DUF222 domain-containing protein [Nakamurella flava]|uniref:DUF222 domain-containing protein n=1 Tax=Nakamurella flava TaxID=2576308 RepID=A0A4U6QF40_9ACTN|nr:DUF222 domain-containing protein [Nakamurella flava]TKV58877.1 DUF222 domain-containing protein [Nakamurella flava]
MMLPEPVLDMSAWRALVTAAPASELPPLLGSRPERPVGCSAREWANVLLDAVIARQRWVAYESARQVHDLVELSAAAGEDPGGVEEFLATELALALGVAESTAGRYLLEAAELTARCPATLHALEQGQISPGKASVICRGTADLTGETTAQVEADVLPAAGSLTVPGLRNAVARSVIRRDPDGAQRRHEQARRRRSVSRRSDLDGMACLSLYGTAQDVAVIWDCLTAAADAGKTEGDDRSIGERRVHALVDVCTDILDRGLLPDRPLPTTQRRRPHLLVTLPASALVNPGSGRGEVAELIGHGPITPAQARVIAADATWRRLTCDPTSGALLDYGRKTYTPPKALTDFVLTRDASCVMPGCRQPAHRCDVDHREPFHPGPPGATPPPRTWPSCAAATTAPKTPAATNSTAPKTATTTGPPPSDAPTPEHTPDTGTHPKPAPLHGISHGRDTTVTCRRSSEPTSRQFQQLWPGRRRRWVHLGWSSE